MTTAATTNTENYLPFIESDAAASAAELRAQIDETGYLFFRALVPAVEVLRVRRDVLDLCDEADWLDRSHPKMEAIRNPDHGPYSEGMPQYMPTYRPRAAAAHPSTTSRRSLR